MLIYQQKLCKSEGGGTIYLSDEKEEPSIKNTWRQSQNGRGIGRGDHFLPQQIHQKIMWMLSNFHKTTSECWLRTPGSEKGSPISSKGGRTKYKRQKPTQKI